jgi:glycosyltransferase involved in cell wall biosynthesis
VLFLDSDDLIEPTAAEKWWWYLETHPECSFIASYHVAFGGLNYLWTGGFHDGWMNTERNRISIILMARKSTYTAVGGFDESMRRGLEDWDFWMKCASRGFWGATIPEYLAWYRVRPDHSDRWESLDEQHLNEYQAELKQKYPNLTNESFPTLTETVNYDLTEVDLESPAFNQIQKDRPHLLIILPWLVTGGAERFTLNLMDQLMERNWDVSIVTTAQSENAWLHEFEARTPFFFNLPNFLPIKDHPRFLGYLMQSRHFDAVLLQGSLEGYRYIPALRAFSPETPILDFLHFVTPEWMEGGFPKLSLLYQDMIDFTLTSCQQVRNWMLEAGAKAEKMAPCYIGVDTQTWKPDVSRRSQVRKSLGIGADEPVLLYAARLEEQKQPDVLIRTLVKLKEKGDAFHTLVAGEGSMRGFLDAEVKRHELMDRIHFLGSVSAEQMPGMMAAADIFFLPSLNEGISQALYEAMATGLVVVSAQVGGQAELVTPDCGVLYAHRPGGDEAEAYAQILHELLADPQRRQAMAAASRRRVGELFTLAQMGDCMHNHLREVIARKDASPAAQLTSTERRAIERETQAQVEYLQTRQRQRWLEREYSALVTPQPPSHWFYLWIRQILFPTYQRFSDYKAVEWVAQRFKKVKGRLVKTA